MNSANIKTKNSRIQVLPRLAWLKRRSASLCKSGMVLIGLIFAGFVFAQIPYEEGKVYVCPLVTKMEEINPRCECRVDLILGETVTSTCAVNGETYEMTLTITEYEGKEYFAIFGFENGGAGVNFTPQAKISAPSEGYVGQEILFDGSQSFDPNEDLLVFSWDFGDGSTSTEKKTTHTYRNFGEYLVTLTVDDGMVSSTATTTIKILSLPTQPPGGFVYFGKEEKITEKEKVKEREMEKVSPKEITQEIKKPEKITKILKIEKPKEKEEGEIERKITESEKEIKTETQAPSPKFLPLFLASLKETIAAPQTIFLLILSISALTFILVKEIRLWLKK
jgi:hypothetical protein